MQFREMARSQEFCWLEMFCRRTDGNFLDVVRRVRDYEPSSKLRLAHQLASRNPTCMSIGHTVLALGDEVTTVGAEYPTVCPFKVL